MHIPDGFLNNKMALGLLAGALGALAFCFSRVLKTAAVLVGKFAGENGKAASGIMSFSESAPSLFKKMAIIAIWVFAAQMFNIPIASSTSAHFLGGVFAAVLVGPFAGFIVISSVLIVQCLFFADGGLNALGANILNMAFIGSFLAYYVYKFFSERNYYLAIAAACFFSIVGASFACLIELSVSGTVSFRDAFMDMTMLHLIFAALETVLTLIALKLFNNAQEK